MSLLFSCRSSSLERSVRGRRLINIIIADLSPSIKNSSYLTFIPSPRAGFSLSGALIRKKCGAPYLGRHPYFFIFSWKTDDLFGHHYSFYSFHSFTQVSPIISGMLLCCKKVPLLLWGPFLWGPLFGRTCWTCLNPPWPSPDYFDRLTGIVTVVLVAMFLFRPL